MASRQWMRYCRMVRGGLETKSRMYRNRQRVNQWINNLSQLKPAKQESK